jgi:hypothetical protein
MLERIHELDAFRQFWFVTITPYGKEMEPYVPDKEQVMDSFIRLSEIVGIASVGWRYDPIFLTEKYDVAFHIDSFEKMAEKLSGYVDQCVISFIDLYEKTKRNFPQARAVGRSDREIIGREFARIGRKYGIQIRSCCEGTELARFGVDVSGCMTKEVVERAIGIGLDVPRGQKAPRDACDCFLGNDIGMYNTCGHGCVYCYANYDRETVVRNMRLHNPKSPFLIGEKQEGDRIHEARQKSYINGQMTLWQL